MQGSAHAGWPIITPNALNMHIYFIKPVKKPSKTLPNSIFKIFVDDCFQPGTQKNLARTLCMPSPRPT
jgi:hypothetical protein